MAYNEGILNDFLTVFFNVLIAFPFKGSFLFHFLDLVFFKLIYRLPKVNSMLFILVSQWRLSLKMNLFKKIFIME